MDLKIVTHYSYTGLLSDTLDALVEDNCIGIMHQFTKCIRREGGMSDTAMETCRQQGTLYTFCKMKLDASQKAKLREAVIAESEEIS